tara:strand:- start:188 stop:442 length:255 start_codon:yes stop_codon:yes gene_type:complete
MNENQRKSDRQYAANMARKYFSGQISKYQVLDSFPSVLNDTKLQNLYKRINNKPRISWFFGVSKAKYDLFMKETYEIINDLESS